MYRLSSLIWILSCAVGVQSQDPHGEMLKIDCSSCHNPGGWTIDVDTFHFNHDTMPFLLEGTHLKTDCRACHISLIFEDVQQNCSDCHTDIHSQSVGYDCGRCHDADNWLVDEIPQLHEQNGFNLEGSHFDLNCVDCHTSESNLRFDRIGNDCVNCHLDTYMATQNPDHREIGFSTNCEQCHDAIDGGDWLGTNHFFFPLTLGHAITDCRRCHLEDDFSGASPECISCHESSYEATSFPNHQLGQFSTDCTACHTTNPGWQPVKYKEHDTQYFPIYSGKHKGEWALCIECHTDNANYAIFSCIDCHEHNDQRDLDDEHDDVSGYTYESDACLRCHPNGDN